MANTAHAPCALITGAGKRIGAEMARRLAQDGFAVALHYNSSSEEAEALAKTLQHQGYPARTFQADLRHPQAVETLFDQVLTWWGSVALLLNNASQFINDDIFDQPHARADDHFAVNLTTPTILTKRMAGQSSASGGLIINMLDNKLSAINPDFHSYTLSKAALATATEMTAQRFGGAPRVCGIAPSVTLISGKQSQENFEKCSRINPLGRRVSPEDLCDAALFLWHTKSINGQVITVDGGQALLGLPRDVAFLAKDGALDGQV